MSPLQNFLSTKPRGFVAVLGARTKERGNNPTVLGDGTDYYEKSRADLLPALDTLFHAAHMRVLLENYAYNKKISVEEIKNNPEILSQAHEKSKLISNKYISIYEARDGYHGRNHARAQLSGKLVIDAVKTQKNILTKGGYETVKDICFNPEAYEICKKSFPGIKKSEDALKLLYLFDVHDCAYAGLNGGEAETKLVKDLLNEKSTINSFIGKLMEVCYGPLSKDSEEGKSELASAIRAYKIEQDCNIGEDFKSKNPQNILTLVAALAATIPFKGTGYLNQMGNRLIHHLSSGEGKKLLPPGFSEDIPAFVDKIMFNAAKMAGCDMHSFISPTIDMRGSVRLLQKENGKASIDPNSKNLFDQFNLAFNCWNTYASSAARKKLELPGGFGGYIDQKKDTIFYPYTAKGADKSFSVDTSELTKDFITKTIHKITYANGRDIILALLKIADNEQFWDKKNRNAITNTMLNEFLPFNKEGKENTNADLEPLKFAIANLRRKINLSDLSAAQKKNLCEEREKKLSEEQKQNLSEEQKEKLSPEEQDKFLEEGKRNFQEKFGDKFLEKFTKMAKDRANTKVAIMNILPREANDSRIKSNPCDVLLKKLKASTEIRKNNLVGQRENNTVKIEENNGFASRLSSLKPTYNPLNETRRTGIKNPSITVLRHGSKQSCRYSCLWPEGGNHVQALRLKIARRVIAVFDLRLPFIVFGSLFNGRKKLCKNQL